MEANEKELESKFYENLKAKLFQKLLSTKRFEDAVVMSPYATYSVWHNGILYTPKFLTADTFVGGNMDFKKGLLQLQIINDELVPKLEGICDLNDDDDIDVAIKKIFKAGFKKKSTKKTKEEKELEELQRDATEDSEDVCDLMDDKAIFDSKWNKEHKNMIEKSFVQFDELINMKGALAMHVIQDLYIVSSLSQGDDLSKISDLQDKASKALRSPRNIAKTLISIVSCFATRVAKDFYEKESHKVEDVKLDISCSKTWANGKKLFDICTNSISKANCPVLNKDYTCEISQNLTSEISNMGKE